MSKHPMQPLYTDSHGVVRFKPNAIVSYLLDNGGIDLNQIACMEFSREDRIQFAQLINYSLRGFGELSYVDNRTWANANRKKVDLTPAVGSIGENDAVVAARKEESNSEGKSND